MMKINLQQTSQRVSSLLSPQPSIPLQSMAVDRQRLLSQENEPRLVQFIPAGKEHALIILLIITEKLIQILHSNNTNSHHSVKKRDELYSGPDLWGGIRSTGLGTPL